MGTYSGSDKRLAHLFEDAVSDVTVDGTSVVSQGVAEIDLSGKQNVLTPGTNVTIQGDVISATDTTYSDFVGATSQVAGNSGLVPAPTVADKDKYLKGDGTWDGVNSASAVSELTDVNLSNLSDGQILTYDAQNQEWVNETPGGGSGNVDDVNVNGVSVVDANKVAQITSYKELTQSEYDALPASKLTDGVLYCIKDDGIVEGNKFAPTIYSLDEREIGVWTDSKPLYQKTVEFTLDATTIGNYVSFNHGIANIDKIVNVNGFVTNDDGTYYDSVRFASYDSGTSSVNAQYSASLVAAAKTSIGYQIGRYMIESYDKLIATLTYTKTTDVPGSGQWGTNNVPMVHYTGTEKIIGTWFGETLYEKTTYLGSLSASTTQSFVVGIGANIVDTVVFYEICGKVPSGAWSILPQPQPSNVSEYSAYIDSYSPTNDTITIKTGSSRSFDKLYITIRYTKVSS